MNWNMMAVRSADDTDGRLYPLLGSGGSIFEIEPLDGEVQTFAGHGLALREIVGAKSTRIAVLKDEDVNVSVTAARVVITSEKWNKGGRAWGVGLGATSALISNVASSIKEARARRGTLLMGHARLNWLSAVGCQAPKRRAPGLVRMVCIDGYSSATRGVMLDVGLRSQDAAEVADLISSHIGTYWLKRADLPDEYRPGMTALARRSSPLRPAPGAVETHSIPIYQKVREESVDDQHT